MTNEVDWTAIRTLQGVLHANAKAKGFWDDSDLGNIEVIGNKLMLIVGEAAEAHEEIRAGIDPAVTYYNELEIPIWMNGPRPQLKPEGVPSELADIVIRVFDLAAALGIDMASIIEEKHAFNTTRPYKHNKQF